MSKQEDNLYSELMDIQIDVFWKVTDLINAKWDSPTLKLEMEELKKQGLKILDEIDVLEKKEEAKGDTK